MKLIRSKVIFDELNHTYELDGKSLSGVTALLSRQLFRNKYDGIPESVMERARQRGTMVHETIEICDTLGDVENTNEDYQTYRRLMADKGLERVENEYTVSDNDTIASQIDLVAVNGNDNIALIDFKTTSKLDKEYLSWQLSIYAYLFEKQNKGLKVRELLAMWLPLSKYGKPEMVAVERIPDTEVKLLIACDKAGIQYTPPKNDLALIDTSVQVKIKSLLDEYKRIEEEVNQFKAQLLEKMYHSDIKKFECDSFVITRKLAGKTKRFDSKRFQEEHKDLYEQYVNEVETKESLLIKMR